MRIVQAASFVAPASGGIRTTLRHLAAGYAGAGHEVVQIVPGAADGEERTAHARIITLRAPLLPGTGYRVLAEPWRVAAVMEREHADRIEIHDRATLRPLGRWARRQGVRSLVVSHERLDRLLGLWTPAPLRGVLPVRAAADRSNRALAAGFDTVVATTGWAATEFVRIGARNLRQVPLGVELDRFQPANHDRTLRRAFARDREILIVAATRLSPEKRVDIALAAVAELVRRRVPVRLVIAGDGASRTRLERLAAGLPVAFLGFVADPRRLAGLLATADLAFAPGPIETFGLAALEAMASGTAPVVHHASALAELVADPAGDGAAGTSAAGTGFTFADAALDLLSIDADRRRDAARARAELFPWSATIDGFLRCHDLPAAAPATAVPAPVPATPTAATATTGAGAAGGAPAAGPVSGPLAA